MSEITLNTLNSRRQKKRVLKVGTALHVYHVTYAVRHIFYELLRLPSSSHCHLPVSKEGAADALKC